MIILFWQRIIYIWSEWNVFGGFVVLVFLIAKVNGLLRADTLLRLFYLTNLESALRKGAGAWIGWNGWIDWLCCCLRLRGYQFLFVWSNI